MLLLQYSKVAFEMILVSAIFDLSRLPSLLVTTAVRRAYIAYLISAPSSALPPQGTPTRPQSAWKLLYTISKPILFTHRPSDYARIRGGAGVFGVCTIVSHAAYFSFLTDIGTCYRWSGILDISGFGINAALPPGAKFPRPLLVTIALFLSGLSSIGNLSDIDIITGKFAPTHLDRYSSPHGEESSPVGRYVTLIGFANFHVQKLHRDMECQDVKPLQRL